jgi:hypothetical protein
MDAQCTARTELLLQFIIAKQIDCDTFVSMAIQDLSAAFDMINVNFLLKHLKIVGLPENVTDLFKYGSWNNHSMLILTVKTPSLSIFYL